MRKRIELSPAEMVKFIIDEPEGSVFDTKFGNLAWKFSHASGKLIKYNRSSCFGCHATPTAVYQDIPWWENIPEEGVLVSFTRYPDTIVTAKQHHKTTQGWDLVWVGDNQVNVNLLIPVTKDHPLIKGLVENA